VIGINGIGLFVDNTIEIDVVIHHVDYLATHIGTRHIGIGIDDAFDSKNPQHSDLPLSEPAALAVAIPASAVATMSCRVCVCAFGK